MLFICGDETKYEAAGDDEPLPWSAQKLSFCDARNLPLIGCLDSFQVELYLRTAYIFT